MGRATRPEENRRARLFGRRAEWLAAAWLTLKGYRILARRFSAAGGEIDIVARRGDVVAFVEVKARPGLNEAAVAISEAKRRRISSAARVWLQRNPWAMRATLRGDAVWVAPRRLPRHEPAAYLLDID